MSTQEQLEMLEEAPIGQRAQVFLGGPQCASAGDWMKINIQEADEEGYNFWVHLRSGRCALPHLLVNEDHPTKLIHLSVKL